MTNTEAGPKRRRALADPRTYKAWAYLMLGLPLGILWFALLVPLYITSTALVIVWIGLPLLLLTHLLSRGIGFLERGLANGMLDAGIPRPRPLPRAGFRDYFTTVMRDGFGWRSLAWATLRLLLGPMGFVLALVAVVVPIALIGAPVSFFFENGDLGRWEYLFLLGPFLGIPLLFVAAAAVRGAGDLIARLSSQLLGPSAAELEDELASREQKVEARLRLDQELHDSIGHVLTMTVVQAGAGAHVFDEDPEFARQALTTIEAQGREALDELDRIIALVRADDLGRLDVPGYESIPQLVERVNRAGLLVEATIADVQVSPVVGRAAYRIVQEALTNAVKHGGEGPIGLTIETTQTGLHLRVRNPLGDQSGPGDGRGLSNMAERAELLGGTVSAGVDGAHFQVVADLPGPIGVPA